MDEEDINMSLCDNEIEKDDIELKLVKLKKRKNMDTTSHCWM